MTNLRRGALLTTGIVIVLFLTGCSDRGSPSLLQSRVEASFDVTAAVTYEMVFDLDTHTSGSGNKVTTTITQGPWGRRSHSSVSAEDRTFSSTLLDLGEEQYICGPDLGEDGGCLRAGDTFEDPEELFAYAFDFAFSFRETLIESDLELVGTSTREVAGIEADCFEVTSTEPQPEEVEVCFSEDGILLSAEVISPQGSISALAVKVSREVQEEDFRLPYPVVPAP